MLAWRTNARDNPRGRRKVRDDSVDRAHQRQWFTHSKRTHPPTLALIRVASPRARVRGASRASRRRRVRTSRAASRNTRDSVPRRAPRARMIRIHAFAPGRPRHSSTRIAPAFIDARAPRSRNREMMAFAHRPRVARPRVRARERRRGDQGTRAAAPRCCDRVRRRRRRRRRAVTARAPPR